jgi:hypothetical protein
MEKRRPCRERNCVEDTFSYIEIRLHEKGAEGALDELVEGGVG